MNAEKIVFEASVGGGNKIAGFYSPATTEAVKGVFQICHGMADYFGRYEELVDHLNKEGWHVCGMDMLGHGESYLINKDKDMPLGFFGEAKDSALCILKDEMKLHKLAKEHFGQDLPYVLYGHSMGSFVARNIYITPEYQSEFDAFIFASTMGYEPAAGLGIALASFFSVFGMKRKPGKLLNAIAFGTYNKRIKDPKTPFDWVTSDEAEVEKYCKDPLAGFLFTCKGFLDLFTLVQRMQSKEAYDSASKAPCMLTYGEDDPVAGYGKGAQSVADKFAENKERKVTVKNYGHYRHEIQNEPVRYDYFNDITEFINKNTEAKGK